MTLTLDDRDPSFSYRGSWGQAGVPGNEFDGTATWTSASGATASLTFAGKIKAKLSVWKLLTLLLSPGIQITVFGTIPPRGLGFAPLSAYSIDDGSSSLYEGILQFSPQYKQALFRSDNLSPMINHTLTIENLVDGGSLFLDFVDIVTTVPPPLPSNTVLPVPETSVPPITTSAKQTISAHAKYSAIKVVHVGAIVGGVLGGTFFIGIIAVLVIILKRKRDSKNQRVDKFEITRTSLLILLVSDCSRYRYNSPCISRSPPTI